MANFPNQQLTNAGWDALSEALAGRRLTFTKMSVGDGLLDGQQIEERTELVHRLYDLPLVNYRPAGQGKVFITANLRSAEVTQGFFLREIGLWCRLEGNPVEILYSLCNSGDQSDYVPGKDSDPGETVVVHAIEIQVIIGKAENIEVEVILGLMEAINVGTGAGVYQQRQGNNLLLRSLKGRPGGLIQIEEQEDEISFGIGVDENGDGTGTNGQGPSAAVITTGCCIPFFGNVIPDGFLLCDGSAHPVEDYPRLFALIGRIYTPSSWAEDIFAVPDCRARALVGTGRLDYDPAFNLAIGQKWGERLVTLETQHLAAHTHTVDINHNHLITTGSHNHGDAGHAHYSNLYHAHGDAGHTHAYTEPRPYMPTLGLGVSDQRHIDLAYGARTGSSGSGIQAAYAAGWTDTRGCGLQAAGNLGGSTNWVSDMATNWNVRTTSPAGTGASAGHENMQPSLAINYLIKT